MKYNFDQPIERMNTNCSKWDGADAFFGPEAKEALPMWVADMDFAAPQKVIDALKARVEHGVFGYPTMPPASYYAAVIGWMDKHYNWPVKREWLVYTPGVVAALNYLVQVFTQEGEAVAIQTPVYYPFTSSIVNNNRQVVINPLKLSDSRYIMDYDDLDKKLADKNVKMLFLCNPHNPVGRVWTRDELTKLGEICLKHNVLVVSDEIHGDLTFKGYQTTAYAGISEELAQNAIVCTAPSKTFNLAGLQTSNMIIPNAELRQRICDYLQKIHVVKPNVFGLLATEVAYSCGEEWLDKVKDYLQGNLEYLTWFITDRIPGINVIQPEGTFLVWLDCRELAMDIQALKRFMLLEARVAMDDGYIFGQGGDGFTRINIACSRATLREGLTRIENAVNRRKK